MKIFLTLLLVSFAYLVTTRGIPFVVVRLGRLLGFRMRLTPLSQKRLQRFKSIKRGYYSFTLLSTFFFLSLFLEVVVNHKPIYLRFDDQVAFPALRDLGNFWFSQFGEPFKDFDRSGDFGIPGESQLDYRLFDRFISNPEGSLSTLIQKKEKEYQKLLTELEGLEEEIELAKELDEQPEAWVLELYQTSDEQKAQIRSEIEGLRRAEEVFAEGRAQIVWPLYPFSPEKNRLDLPGTNPFKPSLWAKRPPDGIRELRYLVGKEEVEATLIPSDTRGLVHLEVAGETRIYDEERVGVPYYTFELSSGETIERAIVSETSQEVKVADPSGEVTVLDQSEIENRKPSTVAYLRATVVPFGTDPAGLDLIPQVLYGFRVSVSFALLVLFFGYLIGITIGALMGYYSGWVDIALQRVIEIWSAIPFLYTIMIVVELTRPGFLTLALMLTGLQAWLGITNLVRGEYYREKAKDYVQSAIGTGLSDIRVIVKHILPNSLVPVVSTAPFAFVAYINALVALDFLGFGLPDGTPSWGHLLRLGKEELPTDPHLTYIPVLVLSATLLMVVLIGEAVREAFDPKAFSRLR